QHKCRHTISLSFHKELLRLHRTVLVLTDINSTAGCMRFVMLSSKYNIKPVLGIDFRNGAEQLFVGVAKNNEGFYELNKHLSGFLSSKKLIPTEAPRFEHSFIIYPWEKFREEPLKENEYVGVTPQDLVKMKFSAETFDQSKMVILQTVSFRNKKDFNAHRLLRAIDNNTILSKLPKAEEGSPNHIMMTEKELIELYEEFPQIIENTRKIIDDSSFHLEFGEDIPHKNQGTYTGSEETDFELIQKLCEDGLKYRYDRPTKKIRKRLETELEIIQQKGFLAYFLINWDILRYARSRDFPYVGRGSGANSIVAYLLKITDVDPIELDLYFERFINLYRRNPPDFDIDFASRDRNDMTDYIFRRFPHTALLATYSTFKYRSVVREIGKVFGLPPHEIDKLSEGKTQQWDQMSLLVLKYGKLIEGFPSHLSIHAGGILIANKPINYYTATDVPPKGFATVQFDMIIAEDIGLYKFDILGQRGLSKIKDTLDLIKRNHPLDDKIDIHDVRRFFDDEKVKELLRHGMAIGCFYVESPAMRMLLKKLKADHYLGLVAASSIIRPGVAKSGMMREYILRFRQPERIKDAHPTLLDIMPDTFGVMVYQEDVIKVAHYFADLTLAEADVLRRGMSGKYRSREEFQKVRNKFFENCRKKGHPDALAADVWRQIESFAGYAFSKGHSASYAVESYQSLFLKAYYPLEYMVATINNGGGFYRKELYVHEARMHGALIEVPCVNTGEGLSIIQGKTIYLGWVMVKDLEENVIIEFLKERFSNGIFVNLSNFVDRVAISLEQLALLIRVGGFRFTSKSKKELLWEAYFLLGDTKKSKPLPMFCDTKPQPFELPPLYSDDLEDAFEEMELLGFPLISPFALLKDEISITTKVADLPGSLNKQITILGYLVTIKNTSTTSKKRMHFGTFIDLEGNFIDTVHFPPV
ncbi:MAG: DNA polymerase III subunit alpha, partial [Bacteroidota bacterium]